MEKLKIGQFVIVGKSIGVVVGLPNGSEIPENHLAVWYGETADDTHGKMIPKVRTVPEDYCEPLNGVSFYH